MTGFDELKRVDYRLLRKIQQSECALRDQSLLPTRRNRLTIYVNYILSKTAVIDAIIPLVSSYRLPQQQAPLPPLNYRYLPPELQTLTLF